MMGEEIVHYCADCAMLREYAGKLPFGPRFGDSVVAGYCGICGCYGMVAGSLPVTEARALGISLYFDRVEEVA